MAKTFPAFNSAMLVGLTDEALLLLWQGSSNKKISFGVFKEFMLQALSLSGVRYRGMHNYFTDYLEGDLVASQNGSGLWRCTANAPRPPEGIPGIPVYDDTTRWTSAEAMYNWNIVNYIDDSIHYVNRTWCGLWSYNRVALTAAGSVRIPDPDYDPGNETLAFVAGDTINIRNSGVYDIEIQPALSAVINAPPTGTTVAPGQSCRLVYVEADTWDLYLYDAGTGGGVVSAPEPMVRVAARTGIIGYGQSLAVGSDGLPIAHTSAVGGHLTFGSGPNHPSGASLLSSSALYERLTAGTQGETPCSALAEGISVHLRKTGMPDIVTFQFTGGIGGYALSSLNYGQPAYTALVGMNTAAANLAAVAAQSYVCSAVWWMQGESDGYTSQATYLTDFTDLCLHLRADLDGPEILTYQTCAHVTTGDAGPTLAQLQADANVDYIHLVTPIYFLSLTGGSNIHLSAASYQEVGFRFARAWCNLREAKPVERIRLVSVMQEGDLHVVVRFSAPTAPLAWDTTRIPATLDMGFKLIDSLGTVPLSSVEIENTMDVRIVAGRVMGTGLVVRYGLDNNSTGWINGGSGNLVDSTPAVQWIDGQLVSLKHWCPAFTAVATKLTSPNYPSTPGPELTAWEHWDFAVDSSSLVGMVNAESLTPAATVNYTAESVICPGGLPGYLNGLSTTFTDRLSYTFVAVIKRPAEAAGEYNFILGTSDVVAGTGAGLIVFSNVGTDITVSVPGVVAFGRDWATPAISVGEWCFVVYRSNAGKSAGMIGGGTLLEDVGVRSIPARNVVLGNVYVPYSNCAREIEFAEAMIFDGVKTEAELNQIFIRSRLRMAAKGITI